jgi:hypothetical protein
MTGRPIADRKSGRLIEPQVSADSNSFHFSGRH